MDPAVVTKKPVISNMASEPWLCPDQISVADLEDSGQGRDGCDTSSYFPELFRQDQEGQKCRTDFDDQGDHRESDGKGISSLCNKMDKVSLDQHNNCISKNKEKRAAQWEWNFQTGAIKKEQKFPPNICCDYCKKPFHYKRNCPQKIQNNEFIVEESYPTTMSDTWLVSLERKCHVTGNKNLIRSFTNSFGIETNSSGYEREFFRGRGSIVVTTEGKRFRIDNVYYVPTLKKNVLSMEKLTKQGFEISFKSKVCSISRTIKENEYFCWTCNTNTHTTQNCPKEIGYCGDSESTTEDGEIKQKKTEINEENLNKHFEMLDIEAQKNMEKDGNEIIKGKKAIEESVKVTNIEECLNLVSLIQSAAKIQELKDIFDKRFEEAIQWFMKEFLYIRTYTPFPPRDTFGHRISLLDLYMTVQMFGGIEKITMHQNWGRIALEMGYGLDKQNASEDIISTLHATYLKYIEMLIWYHDKYQGREINVEKGMTSTISRKRGSAEASTEEQGLPIKKRKVAAVRDWPKGCGPAMAK